MLGKRIVCASASALAGSGLHHQRDTRQTRHATLITLVATLVSTAPAVTEARTLPVVAPVMACTGLLALQFSKTPEVPFRLSTAEVVPVSATNPSEYCRVTGYAYPQVSFEVRLPTQTWTQRLIMSSPGGYAGSTAGPTSVNFPATLSGEAFNCPILQSGEMVRATHDAGHTRKSSGGSATEPSGGADGLFALHNPGALVDFSYGGTHKATVAAKALIKAYYGQLPKYSYHAGCSNGGRQSLMEAQRYPQDFDGILAGSSTIDDVQTNTFYHGWNMVVNSASVVPGTNPPQYMPILTSDKIPALAQAVLAECGNFAGGLHDMIQDPRACNFDARTLICNGPDSPTCLTRAQAETVNLIWQGPVDERGRHMTAGDMPRGSELGWIGAMVTAPGVPLSFTTSSDYTFSWDWPHYMAKFGDPLPVDHDNFSFTKKEYDLLTQLDPIVNSTNPDLRPFAKRGGKLIMWQGWSDTGSTPHDSLNYYDAVRELMGQATDDVLTLYMVPGMYHCNGGPRATREDFLSVLQAWVEDGIAPNKVVINYFTTNSPNSPIALTRPVWPYPSIARYVGSGDPNNEANFVKSESTTRFSDSFEYLGSKQYKRGYQWTCDAKTTTRSYELRCGPNDHGDGD